MAAGTGWANVAAMIPAEPSRTRTLWFVAGEASGDHHAAALARELGARVPGLRLRGLGGPELAAVAEGGTENWIGEAAVVGLVEVLRKYGYFRRRFAAAKGEILATRPEAVVLVDYPGFNLRLAKALRAAGFPGRIIFYISPQVWAWNRGRIPKMARWLDLMLCIFPFEKALYEASGLRTEFVGHPLVDALAEARATRPAREEGLVALLPGSRGREVRLIFPPMLAAAKLLRAEDESLRFAAAAAGPERAAEMRRWRDAAGFDERSLPVQEGGARRLMQRAAAGWVASGTATVEAALLGLPHAIAYRVAPMTYVVGKALIRVPHLGMVNVLAGREVVREFIQGECRPELLAEEMRRLLHGEVYRETQLTAAAEVVGTLGPGGAAARAAEAVIREMGWKAAD